MKKILIFILLVTSYLFAEVGVVNDGKVSTYLRGALQDVDSVKSKLSEGGFIVLSSSLLNKKGTLTSVVFTDDTLSAMANKKERGFIASLRVLVDNENSQISITNPLYFAKAFMQDDYDEAGALTTLSKITKIFSGLKDSKEELKYKDLAGFHFMFGMPYYDEMIKVAEAGNASELLERLKAKDGGANLIFSQKLSENRILVGVKLSDNTSKFIEKVGVENAALLPYPVLLENGKAMILAPKYYIAIAYPLLKMSQFMRISTIPGAIEKDCKKLFK
jgi:hypothetical protein